MLLGWSIKFLFRKRCSFHQRINMVPVALVGRVSSTVRLSRYLNEILLLATGTICAFCVTSR